MGKFYFFNPGKSIFGETFLKKGFSKPLPKTFSYFLPGGCLTGIA